MEKEVQERAINFENKLFKYFTKTFNEELKTAEQNKDIGKITLEEMGEKYSKQLANVMFEAGFGVEPVIDAGNFEDMKYECMKRIVDEIPEKESCDKFLAEISEVKDYSTIEENLSKISKIQESNAFMNNLTDELLDEMVTGRKDIEDKDEFCL